MSDVNKNLPPLSVQAQKAVSKYAFLIFEKGVKYIRKKYKLKDWIPTLLLDYSYKFTYCYSEYQEWNKTSSIVLSFYTLEKRKHGKRYLDEYNSFASDPEIGSVLTMNWKKVVAGYVMHELAHAVQWTPGIRENVKKGLKLEAKVAKDKKMHGVVWKEIYRDLRIKFVNHLHDRDCAFV